MADTKHRIEEHPVDGKPLGRHVNHDPRSLLFQVEPRGTVASKSWKREVPIFDQGELGSCTGNAGAGTLGTDPYLTGVVAAQTLDEKFAVALYSDATVLDDQPENYPPTDTGSDGLSVAKVLKAQGLISGYLHITSLDAAHTAIQTGPFMTGVSWYEGFDSPDSKGRVHVRGAVRGGHEFSVIGYDADAKLWTAANSWGTSYGHEGYFQFSDDDYARLLHEEGDATVFVPAGAPAPAPAPVSSAWPAADVDPWLLAKHSGAVARRAQVALIALRSTLGGQ